MATVGSYELLEIIGRGGMGEVWLARHATLGRLAAVKLIQTERFAVSPELRTEVLRRFEREAQATSQLRSPHTVAVYDFGSAPAGAFYYAMELLDGYTLQEIVDAHGALPPARAVHIVRQICDALAEAHDRGLVHRDIKPANVFVCRLGLESDFVKVVDFGLVKGAKGTGAHETTLTRDGGVAGSPAYMAPEAVKGGAIDARSDVYAIGCVLFWLLTAKLVFDAATALEMVVAHATRAPEPPSTRSGVALPEPLERLVLECLAKTPETRPADAREVGRRLADCAQSLGSSWGPALADAWWTEHARPARTPSEQELRGPDRDAIVKRVGNALENHFAASRIDVLEYERRLEIVRRGRNAAGIEAALEGLPAPPVEPAGSAIAVAPQAIVPANESPRAEIVAQGERWETLVSVLGESARGGLLRLPPRLRAVTVLGSLALDLREAEIGPTPTVLQCVCVLGEIVVSVPEGVRVEVAGASILGSFTHHVSVLGDPGASRVLRIVGVAVLGNVRVITATEHGPSDQLTRDCPGSGPWAMGRSRMWGSHRRRGF